MCLGFDLKACQSLSRSSSSQRLPELHSEWSRSSPVGSSLAWRQVAQPIRRCSSSLVFTKACASSLVGLWSPCSSCFLRARLPSSCPSLFTLAQSTPGTWAHWCRAVISRHSVQRPNLCGVGPGCSASVTQRWVRRTVTPILDRSWRQHVERSLGLLHTIRCDPRAQPQLSLLRSSTVSLSTQDSHGGGALRDVVKIQAQVVELPVTGTHLPSAASVALMWVTWRTACPAAQYSRTSGRSGALTLAWRPLMVMVGLRGVGFRPLARGQHSVGHAGSRPIRGTHLLRVVVVVAGWTSLDLPHRAARARTRQPENSKRARFRAPALQNTTKIPREDTQRDTEKTK